MAGIKGTNIGLEALMEVGESAQPFGMQREGESKEEWIGRFLVDFERLRAKDQVSMVEELRFIRDLQLEPRDAHDAGMAAFEARCRVRLGQLPS